MTQDGNFKDKLPELRRRAENVLVEKAEYASDVSSLSSEEVRKLVHELQVHQIELEMQNEELREAQIALNESRNKYLDLYDYAPVGYFTLDRKGTILEANLTAVRLLGIERESLLKQPFPMLVLKGDADAFYLYLQRVCESPAKQTCEIRIVRQDGSHFPAQLDGMIVQDGNDQFSQCHVVLTDITDRKKIEDLLQASEERFRSLIDQAADAIFVHGVDGRFLEVNQQGCTSLGYSRDELLSMSVTDVDPDAAPRGDKSIFWPNLPATFEAKHKRKDGTTFPVEIRLGAIEYGSSKVVLAMARDQSHHKRVENALRESEERYRILADNALQGVYLHQGTFFVYANRRLEEILGYAADELTEMRFWEIFHPDIQEKIKVRGLARYRGEQAPSHYVSRIVTKDGKTRLVEVAAVATEYRGKVATAGAFVDITERREAEDALRKSEEFNRRLVEHVPCGIVYLAGDGTIEYVNPAAKRIGGVPEDQEYPTLGKNIFELPGLSDRSKAQEIFRRLLEGKSFSDLEVPYKTSAGRYTVLLVAATPKLGLNGTVEGAILIFKDITERKRLEEIQGQTARLRAVADMAAGVAHNFNNLLHIVIGYLELALIDLESGDHAVVRDSLEKVLKSSRLGAEVVRRLQRFAQQRNDPQVSEKKVFDLADIAEQVVNVSQVWLTAGEKEGRKVSLHTRLKEGCFVSADMNEIFGVVIDLVRNAVEALPEGGDVDLITAIQEDTVVLQVKDTGIGIDKENLGRLFNPFFTTKAEPGAGLSLASGRKIIDHYGGHIRVDSVEGQGTTFTVKFPLAEKLPESTKTPPERETERSLTILVIDDVEAITDLMKSALTAYGHAVLTALSGEEGIEIFEENSADVVICDLGMPRMNGWEVGKRIKVICQKRGLPKTPFILLTAWAGQETATEEIAQSGIDAVVGKPLNVQNLREIIWEVLQNDLTKDAEM